MSALHPSVPTMSGGRLVLQNIGCKLHFISSAEEIKNLLTSFPPRISVCDDNANAKICIAQTSLDVQRLFNQHKVNFKFKRLTEMDKKKLQKLMSFFTFFIFRLNVSTSRCWLMLMGTKLEFWKFS